MLALLKTKFVILETLFVLVFIAAALFIAGLIYQAAGTIRDQRRFPPPGRLIDIGARRLHLVEAGQGRPAVILESGISASCLNWTEIRNRVSKFTRCASYDRAGLGWSDPATTPRTTLRLVDELHALLQAAGVPPPYVLVGHSFGGLLVRGFAVRYADEVAGVVLLDPLCPEEWQPVSEAQSRMLRRGVRLSRRGAVLARLGIVRLALMLLSAGSRRLPQLIAKVSSGRGESTISRIVGEVRKMPVETWPVIQAHWCQPKSFRGMARHLESLPESCAEAAPMRLPPSMPVTILSASNSTAGERAGREAMALSSSRGRHIIAAESGHWIHLDEPELVVQAIWEMVERARSG